MIAIFQKAKSFFLRFRYGNPPKNPGNQMGYSAKRSEATQSWDLIFQVT